MIIHDNVNGVGANHLSRTHNPAGGAMRKSIPQTSQLRLHDLDIKAEKCHSQIPQANHQSLAKGIESHTQGDIIPELKDRIPSPHRS